MAKKKFDFKSHRPVHANGVLKGYDVTPYTRFKQGENPPVFIQSGRYWDAGGNEIEADNVPDWVHEHLKLMRPVDRVKHGFPERLGEKPHESVAKD